MRKNIGVDPFAYLRDVLSRIATHPMRRSKSSRREGPPGAKRSEHSNTAA
jgi:transposase IS66-like protein